MSQQAPLWAFVAEAIDGAGDTHLPKGIHVRALPSPRLGVPATPLIVTRTILSPDLVKRYSRNDGVVWIDSHGATLTPPFAVTRDNPVYGYFPVPNVIFTQLSATPAPPTPPIVLSPTVTTAATPAVVASPALTHIADVLHPAQPIGTPVAATLDLGRLADVLESSARIRLPPATGGYIRFEALANSDLGPTPFQARLADPWLLAAWTIPMVRVIGRGTVNGIIWLDAARLGQAGTQQEKFWEIWSLPIKQAAPRYANAMFALTYEVCDRDSGTNENTNGLLRQYFPKGTDLSMHSAEEIAAVAAALNSRPRKTLDWKTPAEALDQLLLSANNDSVATTA